jgi:predicted Zn-dependent protease
MARELIEIADELGDKEKAFSGHLHAFGAFMVRGDVGSAEREFEAASAVAKELHQPLQLWGLAMASVMCALQTGRFEDAEQLIERAVALGSGRPGGGKDDATFQYVRHFHEWALARERAELAQIRGSLERYLAEYPDQFVLRCMLVNTYCEVGDDQSARAELERLVADGFQTLEVGTEWFFGASLLAEACERLREPAPRAAPLRRAPCPIATTA